MSQFAHARFIEWALTRLGSTYNDLTLVEIVPAGRASQSANVKYVCQCKCGRKTTAFLSNIVSNRKRNCGQCQPRKYPAHGYCASGSGWRYLYRRWTELLADRRCAEWSSFPFFKQWCDGLLGDKLTPELRGLTFTKRTINEPHGPTNTIIRLRTRNCRYSYYAQPT